MVYEVGDQDFERDRVSENWEDIQEINSLRTDRF